jgi:hypothetical protein
MQMMIRENVELSTLPGSTLLFANLTGLETRCYNLLPGLRGISSAWSFEILAREFGGGVAALVSASSLTDGLIYSISSLCCFKSFFLSMSSLIIRFFNKLNLF